MPGSAETPHTSGSPSGHAPVAPSGADALWSEMSASRKSRTGMAPPGPTRSDAVARTPVAAPVIAIWNAVTWSASADSVRSGSASRRAR